MKIILYTGPHCSLCDDAIALIDALDIDVELEKINIRKSTDLYHLYGSRIPVVKHGDKEHASAEELGWPFTIEQLRAFLV